MHDYMYDCFITFMYVDQCPTLWANNMSLNVSFEYNVGGPQLVCKYLSPQGEIVLICTNNGS